MKAAILSAIAFFALTQSASASDESTSTRCRQEFSAIDDQADLEIRDLNRLIMLLESEVEDPGLAASSEGFRMDLRNKLEATKQRRAEVFDKQHDDLNAIRAKCSRSRPSYRSGAIDSTG